MESEPCFVIRPAMLLEVVVMHPPGLYVDGSVMSLVAEMVRDDGICFLMVRCKSPLNFVLSVAKLCSLRQMISASILLKLSKVGLNASKL